ncbi:FAD-binding oxidoreductase [Pseudonocardia hydrocarbonoxydans]|uniref:Delta(24)-sterol reductase n=1 Tax=Pseudonocardia hydrocarbonoxydans TaxID=76726 RepID=A0A4Y3WKL4_9PSEU|nr:FAD-binding oxidoreductase [Pseudonocardia hydrocarbonoxydans]GEC18459.1 FAD-linked oxidase [Pseudonocardia hydrocarbonoxydans]
MSAGLQITSPHTVPRAVHDAAVAELVRQYRAVPPGERVRLGKRTSNLFRFGTGGADDRRLDTSAFTGVIEVDTVARTAQVQGMATYEHLVEVTLAHGLMPLVVPQLRTITLGGAVTGLGIESTSFRHGLPHESVREMDVLLPGGELVTVRPEGEHADLFAGFANSYATLGYALRLEIDLQPVAPYVRLEHQRVPTGTLVEAIEEACAGPADFVDGVVFTRDEQYLTLAYFTDDPGPGVSDYTGQQVFYRSVRERVTDHLTIHDYLWRWDTDWFWCSAALGAQHPLVRRVWPRRYRRSDVYRRIVALDRRTRFSSRVRRLLRQPQEEPVIQDVEIPVGRLPEFLDAFQRDVGIEPVWLCPLTLRGERTWPLYPMEPHELYVNVGFWSTVPEVPGDPEGHNRRVERLVAELGGHKSLYSTVHYDEREFWEHYNGPAYRALKARYDPDGRLPDLYSKVTGRP